MSTEQVYLELFYLSMNCFPPKRHPRLRTFYTWNNQRFAITSELSHSVNIWAGKASKWMLLIILPDIPANVRWIVLRFESRVYDSGIQRVHCIRVVPSGKAGDTEYGIITFYVKDLWVKTLSFAKDLGKDCVPSDKIISETPLI